MRDIPVLRIPDSDIAHLAPLSNVARIERGGLPLGPAQRQARLGDRAFGAQARQWPRPVPHAHHALQRRDAVRRVWWHRFGPMFASEIRKRRIERMKSSRWRWHLDEMFVKINGERHYLWRAVDHEGEMLESFATKTRDKKAAIKFMRKAMKKHGRAESLVTHKLRSYRLAQQRSREPVLQFHRANVRFVSLCCSRQKGDDCPLWAVRVEPNLAARAKSIWYTMVGWDSVTAVHLAQQEGPLQPVFTK